MVRTKVPKIISPAPIAVFTVSASFKMIMDRIIVMATLNLSIAATF